ncbi:phosphatidylglycerophosphatase A family protein [Thiobacter aerophilum]|uniref:Phosphatidylglycerophosphatase A n=1 Tax=Thiobacter aerophilum TaxID=3121275 RepID=A0ABV0EHA1_9BURK
MTTSPDLRYVLGHPLRFIAFGFGSGLSPVAPGTVGTLVGFPLFWLILQASPTPPVFFGLLASLFLLGVVACARVGREVGVADYGGIVWDEVIAFLLILWFTPFSVAGWTIAFFVFRVFDVWKPFPIRYFDQRFKNGFGVMFDDLLAAIYSVITIKVLFGVLYG